jgi:hypothetical protein
MSNGGDARVALHMNDFSISGTSIGSNGVGFTSDPDYFFDANGVATEIVHGSFGYTSLTGVYGNDVVGYSADDGRSFLWRNGTFTDIFVPGATATWAEGIFENLIVGSYYNNDGIAHGFLYDGSSYSTIDAPDATNTFFKDIEGTQAVGYYTTNDGFEHGFIASSVPEPSSLSLLFLGGVVIALRRRKR